MPDLVIPGVAVRVVKEVIAPQLAPSGILGIVGPAGATKAYAGAGRKEPASAKSWARFVELFGPATARAMPEAVQALQNGVSELVVVPVDNAAAATGTLALDAVDGGAAQAITFSARAPGPWANGLRVTCEARGPEGARTLEIAVVQAGERLEVARGFVPGQKAADTADQLSGLLSLVSAAPADAEAAKSATANGCDLAGGADAAIGDYEAALDKLKSEPDVDMVVAAVGDWGDAAKVARVHAAVASHCALMAGASAGRIGLAEVLPPAPPAPPPPPAKGKAGSQPPPRPTPADQANQIRSDRMVLVAPHGALGAVAGMIGSLDYFQSPTFKTVLGAGDLPRLSVEEQEALLKAGVVPVAAMRGRGTVVVRGITTDGDQISVRRVADRAVRGVKMIGELFIGRLNNSAQRGALQEKLVEFLVQMERDGALVPSTDGKDPAFKVAVYSSQADFQQGIVRVDMAVRPVRAIDYIYATVLVQG